jgi:hypothetical protein
MGIANLMGPYAKIGRAQEHFDTLYREIFAFAAQYPDPVYLHLRREGAWDVLYIDPFPAFPVRLALIAGDCLNNVRMALDHLIWQLVLREDQEPSNTHQFPICKTAKQFRNEVKLPAQKGAKGGPLRGIPVDGDAWALIEGAQPFHSADPEYHPLCYLPSLTNIDKHRTLLVQQLLPNWLAVRRQLGLRFDAEIIEEQVFMPSLSSEHPTEIARFRFATEAPPKMQMEGNFSVHPTFGDSETQVGVGKFSETLQYVNTLLEQMAALPRVQR